MSESVVVIGGGIAGLATAGLLAKDGWSVDLVEQRPDVGGRAGTWESEGFRFDTGPSWYLMPEVFEHFFELMGSSADAELDLVTLDPGYRVFFKGHAEAVDIAADRDANIALFEGLEPGAGPALGRYLDSAEGSYRLALDKFLYNSFQSATSLVSPAVLRWGPKLVSLLTTSLGSYISSRFTDPRLRQILGYPAVFLGTSPDRAPSLYHLMSKCDLVDGVLYPQGGLTTVIAAIERLAVAHGVRIHRGTTVTAILTSGHTSGRGKRAAVSGVQVLDGDGKSRALDAEFVVAAADLHHVETQLLPEELRTYPEPWWRKRDPGPGAVLAYLGVQGEIPELAHHSLFFTEDWEANFDDIFEDPKRVPQPASTYVCRPSATDDQVAPPDAENLFILVPVPADVSVGHGGMDGGGDPEVEKAVDAAIDQIASWAGVPDLASRVILRRTVGPADFASDLNAWSGGALGPAHVLSQSAMFRAGNVSKKVDGLLYAGSSTIPGVGLPMCLISAELVLKRLRGDRSSAPISPMSPVSPLLAGG